MRTPIALALLLAASHAHALEFDDAWIREAPPGAAVLAGYIEIRNDGKADVTLVSAESEAFGEVEFHEMSMTEGVMKMRGLDTLVIPAGKSISLKPGATHLMLTEPKASPKAGDQVHIAFEDAKGKRRVVTFTVRAATR